MHILFFMIIDCFSLALLCWLACCWLCCSRRSVFRFLAFAAAACCLLLLALLSLLCPVAVLSAGTEFESQQNGTGFGREAVLKKRRWPKATGCHTFKFKKAGKAIRSLKVNRMGQGLGGRLFNKKAGGRRPPAVIPPNLKKKGKPFGIRKSTEWNRVWEGGCRWCGN